MTPPSAASNTSSGSMMPRVTIKCRKKSWIGSLTGCGSSYSSSLCIASGVGGVLAPVPLHRGHASLNSSRTAVHALSISPADGAAAARVCEGLGRPAGRQGSAKPLSPSSASATANHCRAALGLPGGELQVLGDGALGLCLLRRLGWNFQWGHVRLRPKASSSFSWSCLSRTSHGSA